MDVFVGIAGGLIGGFLLKVVRGRGVAGGVAVLPRAPVIGLLLDAAGRWGPVGRVVLNRSSRRAASLVGWGLFLPPVMGEWLPTSPSPPNVKPLWLGAPMAH